MVSRPDLGTVSVHLSWSAPRSVGAFQGDAALQGSRVEGRGSWVVLAGSKSRSRGGEAAARRGGGVVMAVGAESEEASEVAV